MSCLSTHLVGAVGGPVVLLADPALDHALRGLLLQQVQRRLLLLAVHHVGLVLKEKWLKMGEKGKVGHSSVSVCFVLTK